MTYVIYLILICVTIQLLRFLDYTSEVSAMGSHQISMVARGPNLNESQGCWNIGSKLDLPIYQLIAHCDPKISVKLADSFGSDK